MRRNFLYPAIILLGALVFASCNSADSKVKALSQKTDKKPAPETTYADGARRITVAELQEMLKNGEAAVFDVRNEASYDAGHIPGAKLIPADQILNHIDELPKNKLIVTYCS
jgi:3-mercaptopyruvate sulfurtransferase SseA